MPTDLTIAIPAYDNPEYLRRALDSIQAQTLRPLKVVVFDDASPTSLEPTVGAFRRTCSNDIEVEYVRFPTNRKIDAFYEIYEHVQTPWMLQMHHDDELLDPYFLATWQTLKTDHPDLSIIYANAVVEGSMEPMIPIEDCKWNIVDGSTFAVDVLRTVPTAWSAVIYRTDILKRHHWPRPPMFLDNEIHRRTGLDRDEGFNTLYLLATEGRVAKTDAVVAMRGMPETAYSRSHHWATPGNSLYVIYSAAHEYFMRLGRKDMANLVGLARLWYGLPVEEGWRLSQVRQALAGTRVSTAHYISLKTLTFLGLNQIVLARKLSSRPENVGRTRRIGRDDLKHSYRTTKGNLKWSVKRAIRKR